MDHGYEAFVMAQGPFYDAVYAEQQAGACFPAAQRALPEGWHRHEQDDWTVVDPGTSGLPAQGWKIHASATLGNSERVLDAVCDYCLPRGIHFKFLRSKSALLARVSKYAPRGYSGKLVTIFPADDRACETILRELGEVLDGEPGPYILSDLRWGKGPLYVRYGAFAMQHIVDGRGELVPAIRDADGNLVPDRRDPVFHVPPWVPLPDFLAPHLAARNAVTVADLPYSVERVLHFSNGGGVYLGRDTRTGEQVVLKEGRPHCGLDAADHDAVRRVEREYDVLRRLDGIPGIPRAHDLFWVGEHRFLAMEFVDGQELNHTIVSRYPMLDLNAGPADYARFTDWAMHIHRQVEATLEAVHERGVVYGDLHLFNIMVGDDDTISLLDFEVAAPIEEGVVPGLGNQGFMAPRAMTGFDIDRYALACLRLAMFLPITTVLGLHRPKAQHLAEIIAEHFPVPQDYLAAAVEVIAPSRITQTTPSPLPPNPRIEPDPALWPQLRADLARAIVASATPERDDRLFPGDPEQFALGGLGLAFGAAGVLYALSATGGDRHPRFEEWLLRRATNPPEGTGPGLYTGLHGAAFTLDHLGYRQAALDTLDVCLREKWETLGPDLMSGLAGVGLNLLHFADRTGEPALRAAAHRAAELVVERLGDQDPGADATSDRISGGERPHAGLMRGRAGQALLLLRAYDDTGDTGFLDCAAGALRHDLRRCRTHDDGTLAVDEGWRTMPYLDVGSTGIGLVVDEYLSRRDDEQLAEASHGIQLAACSPIYVEPGLFSGRAGILLYLAGRSPSPIADPRVARQVRGLAWHALPYGDGMAFPGSGLLRLSMDLATGTAGVLLALGAALHDQPVHAPLLTPTRRAAAPDTQTPAPLGAGS